MKSRKQWAGCLISIVLFSQIFGMVSFAKPDWPSDTGIMAEAGVVMDADTGALIFGQNSRLEYYPASIVKLMTALVVLEHVSLDEKVVFTNDAVNNVEPGSGNAIGLDVGDELSVKDCLYALLLRSSNQAANALAEHVGGTRDGFVEMMNARAAEIGCTGSHFKNPSGLNDPEQLVTAYDMALISRVAFNNPDLLEIASAKSYALPATKNNPEGFTVSVEHKILKAEAGSELYCEGAVAGKTGWTSLAGNTLVTYAERDGRRLIAVILKGEPTQYYLDTITLLEFGFSRVKNVDVTELEGSYITGEEPVAVGDTTYAPGDLEFYHPYVTLPNDAEYGDAEKTFETALPAGSPEGAVAVLRYTYNERKVGEVFLRLKVGTPEVETESTEAEAPEELQETPVESLPETEPEATLPTENQPDSWLSGLKLDLNLSRNAAITLILVGIAIVLALVTLVFSIRKILEIRREQEDREVRRAIRKLRLMEEGISEEEFDRLLEARMNRARGIVEDDQKDDIEEDDFEEDDIEDLDIWEDDTEAEDMEGEDIWGDDAEAEDVEEEDICGDDAEAEDIEEDIYGDDAGAEDVEEEDICGDDSIEEDAGTEGIEDVEAENIEVQDIGAGNAEDGRYENMQIEHAEVGGTLLEGIKTDTAESEVIREADTEQAIIEAGTIEVDHIEAGVIEEESASDKG